MRARERNLQEEWLRTLVAIDPRDGLVAGPRGGMQAFRQRVGAGVEIVPAEPGGIGIEMRRLRPEPTAVIAAEVHRFDPPRLIEQRLMVPVHVALRMVVQLADGGGVVAGLGQRARHFHRVLRAHLGVAQHAVIPRREPGEQPGARGSAGRRGGIRIDEAHALRRELIQMRGAYGAIAGRTEAIGAPLVGHQQQDVGARGLGPRRLRQECRRQRAIAQQVSPGHPSTS